MVHGNYYSVEYYIYLSKPLDYFNDILPICKDIRYLIPLIDNNRLKVFDYNRFGAKFQHSDIRQKYIASLDEISYQHLKDRDKDAELFKYYDVKIYNKYKYDIKSGVIKKVEREEFNKLEKRFRELYRIIYTEDNYTPEYYKEMKEINNILDVQRIIIDDKYHEEIKMMESEIIDIEISDEENQLITKILNHPILEGLVVRTGFELICEFF